MLDNNVMEKYLKNILSIWKPKDISIGDIMKDFKKVARELAEILSNTNKGIYPQDLPKIISQVTSSSDINCYPGFPDAPCYPEAFFISLSYKKYTQGHGHLTFREALDLFTKHMQGDCKGKTQVAIIISDSWDPEAFNFWRSNIEQVRKNGVQVEIFLISLGIVTAVDPESVSLNW